MACLKMNMAIGYHFCRAMLCISAACVSAGQSRSWIDIFKLFSPLGSHTIVVYCTKPHGNIPTATPLMAASNVRGIGRNRDSESISGSIACTLSRKTLRVQLVNWQCFVHVAVTRLQATLANTFLLILQNNALADLGRVVVDFRVHLVVVNFCLQQWQNY